jgi:glyceraldehyde-3-phosphate dehydrogenase (NADP+)
MRMLVAGEWLDKPNRIDVRHPFNGHLIDTVPAGDARDVERAIASAAEGFEEMRELPSHRRSRILATCAGLLDRNREELALLIAREVGKTIREARLEVSRAIETFTLAGEEAKRIRGETVPLDAVPGSETKIGFYFRVPLGVIAAITPFNFPLNLVAHKVAPALAGGNAVVLKPATATPLIAIRLAELLLESGLPPRGLSVVTGSGSEIGDAIVRDPRVRMVTFTGSLDVGTRIMSRIGLKKATMELGSNSAVIIMNDGNVVLAAARIAVGGYTLAGQVCISVQRVFVQEAVFDSFLGELVPRVSALRVGDPLQESTDIGPMISEEAAAKAEEWVQEAVQRGGTLALGGARRGAVLDPVVLTHVPRDCRVCCEEAFAPLVVVNSFKTIDEAIALVNDSKYGLQAGIYTADLASSLQAIKRIETGGVMVNEIPTYRADLMPYGGVKGSGLGREGVRHALEEMTELKMVVMTP